MGPNVWLTLQEGGCYGAILETVGPLASDASAHARWRALVCRMCDALGWPKALPAPGASCAHTDEHTDGHTFVRVCGASTLLALRAPLDQLMLATDINEWAWEMATGLIGAPGANLAPPFDAAHAEIPSEELALQRFTLRVQADAKPHLMALLSEAQARHIPTLLDDEWLTIGTGQGGQTWSLASLPDAAQIAWSELGSVPAVLVTGTNGKTTSARLLAACAKQAGWRVGYCCTDGVQVDGLELAAGDYSGPAGARTVLRQKNVDCAVLETARGGILRRGLALNQAQVALVTNVSPEHFGEYGVNSLDDLAQTKLVVAQALGPDGTLVLNADDPVLLAHAQAQVAVLSCQLGLFALDYAHPALQAQRARGAPCCGIQGGRLLLYFAQQEHDLGAIVDMPLTIHGSAQYNSANCAGAALAAAALGIASSEIRGVLAQFGLSRFDNPGRLERWHFSGLYVLLDYAHNPEGLSGLLSVARGLLQHGRLGLLLGQAGNRSNDAIAELAAMAASFKPDHIVLKDIEGYMRGREVGEVPRLLQDTLQGSGVAPDIIVTILPEVAAACALLEWARTGDVLVLPVHDSASKQQMRSLLDTLQANQWQGGQALPAQNQHS